MIKKIKQLYNNIFKRRAINKEKRAIFNETQILNMEILLLCFYIMKKVNIME